MIWRAPQRQCIFPYFMTFAVASKVVRPANRPTKYSKSKSNLFVSIEFDFKIISTFWHSRWTDSQRTRNSVPNGWMQLKSTMDIRLHRTLRTCVRCILRVNPLRVIHLCQQFSLRNHRIVSRLSSEREHPRCPEQERRRWRIDQWGLQQRQRTQKNLPKQKGWDRPMR